MSWRASATTVAGRFRVTLGTLFLPGSLALMLWRCQVFFNRKRIRL